MWGGQMNNELISGSQFERQFGEQNTNLCSEFDINFTGQNACITMDKLQDFHSEQTMSSLPSAFFAGQIRNESLFAPENVEHLNSCTSVNNIDGPHSGFSAAHMGYQQSNIRAGVGGGTILRSVETRFPYGDTTARMFNTSHDISHAMKRKAEVDDSPFYSGAKRRITDEHMAAEMNSLYITNDHNYCGNASMFNPDHDLDMQFSTISEDIQNDNDDDIDQGEIRKDYPVFHFTASLEQMLKKKDDILPQKIFEEISRPCLAMVPWTPPLHNDARITFKRQEQRKETDVDKMPSKYEEMEDENFVS